MQAQLQFGTELGAQTTDVVVVLVTAKWYLHKYHELQQKVDTETETHRDCLLTS